MPPSTLPQAAVRRQAKNTIRQPCDKKNKICKTENKYAGQKKEFHGLCQKKKQVRGDPAFLSIHIKLLFICCRFTASVFRTCPRCPIVSDSSGYSGENGKGDRPAFFYLFSEWWKNSPPEAISSGQQLLRKLKMLGEFGQDNLLHDSDLYIWLSVWQKLSSVARRIDSLRVSFGHLCRFI